MQSMASQLRLLVSPGSWREVARDLDADAEHIRQRPYGTIVIHAGEFDRIAFRRWPKLVSLPEVWWSRRRRAGAGTDDVCHLYYDQPRGMPNFLALKYVVSSPGATYRSFRRAMQVLDAVASIKRTDAIVCEASNLRISERLTQRWGWERHCLQSSRRHYIKRFYGQYPRRFDAPQESADSLASEPKHLASSIET